jgi:cobalt-zinc-cadmium efflux system membrane fusion protein
MQQNTLAGKIKIDYVQTGLRRSELFTAGIVKAIPHQYAEIASPFGGRVIRSYIKLGMKVSTLTPLFEISSPVFMSAQKTFFQEKEQLALAEKKLSRQLNLNANGVGTQKELEEAQSAYDVEKKEFENARLGIKLFNADPDKLVLGQPLTVLSPIAGEIIDNKLVVGQFVKNDAESIATVANLTKVWICGQIKEKNIGALQSLHGCKIHIDGLPGQEITGRIFHISKVMDEATRSVQVLIECENKNSLLKPGMYATVDFINTAVKAISVPDRAVLQRSNAQYVFKQLKPGTYIRQSVETASSTAGTTFISKGLSSGDIIISNGAYLLTAIR